ncbi:MAG TPA: MBL fold metallo-hydrolase [Caulobacteraceae bacterium]
MSVSLSFHGAAGCVTGFCARLKTDAADVLVDCGLFQGPKTLKALNYDPFPFDAAGIDAVLLTHAHVDHSGQLPKLMRAGFRGPIHATAATRELCGVLLPDAGHIQESEVRHLNRRNRERGRATVQPIYTARDGERVIKQFRTVKLHDWIDVAPGVRACYWDAGHILGSASIEVEVARPEGPLRLFFSGDLGPGGREYAADPEGPSEGLHHLIMESTYGDREREMLDPASRRRALARELADAHAAGGPLLIPAFAVERTQELLADLVQIMRDGEAPVGPIFLDSPLAIKASEVFVDHAWVNGRNPFADIDAPGRITPLVKPRESDRLERLSGWHIILAASGMCDAGRVRKHLKRLLWRREATVLLSGFQAAGTLGRLLQDGREMVRIQGEPIRVRARIRAFDVYSGHADANGLVAWAKARGEVSGRIFLAHGEPAALAGLRQRLEAAGCPPDKLVTPEIDQRFALSAEDARAGGGPGRLKHGEATALDWHNLRVELLNDLDERLDRAANDGERRRILARLQRSLG